MGIKRFKPEEIISKLRQATSDFILDILYQHIINEQCTKQPQIAI